MSEKRFVKDMLNIVDEKTNRAYTFEFEKDLDEMLDLLNEQQATIKHIEEYCGDLEADVKRLMKENEQLRKENKEVRQELAEQLTLHSNWIMRKDRYEEELLQEIEKLKRENKALALNVEWFSQIKNYD